MLRNVFFTTYQQVFSPRLASAPAIGGEATWEISDGKIIFVQEYTARIAEESSSEPMMLLKARYELLLFTEGLYSEEFAKEYSNRQLHVMVRPYFRELVANMAPRALITAQPVPTQFIMPKEIIEFPASKSVAPVEASDAGPAAME